VVLLQVFGDQPMSPLGVGLGWFTGRGRDDQQVHVDVVDRWTSRARPVGQRAHPAGAVVTADLTHGGRGAADLPGDLPVRDLAGRGEQDPGPLDLPELAAGLPGDPGQRLTAAPGQPYRAGTSQPGHDRAPHSMIDKM